MGSIMYKKQVIIELDPMILILRNDKDHAIYKNMQGKEIRAHSLLIDFKKELLSVSNLS